MTKRHEGLIPLTHDHHHALAQARGLEESAEEGTAERTVQAIAFLAFFENDTLAHFREEEELVFPLVIDVPDAQSTLTRLLLEHVHLHSLVGRLRAELAVGEPSSERMKQIASLLKGHIRLEEKVLFPLVEQLAPAALEQIELAPRVRGTTSI